MKVERVVMSHLRMELASPFETSFGRSETRDCVLLQVFSDGLVGLGECVADRGPAYSSETIGTAWHILRDFLVPSILDRQIAAVEEFNRQSRAIRGHHMAKAGLEMALWDLHGKRAGRSLKDMLGGIRPQVQVGVSVGIQESASKLAEVVAGYVSQGYARVKIKIKPGREVADARAVRRVFPSLALQVDANSAYTLETAEALLPLDELDLVLIEQPLAEDDLWDHRQLQARLRTPLCLDESIRSISLARQALAMEACRVINIKAGRVGGLGPARAIHDLCLEQGVPVWCGGMLETGVGRAANLALASLPGFILPGDISATDRYYAEDITRERFDLSPDSTIRVPDGPGLGINLDERAVMQFTLAELALP